VALVRARAVAATKPIAVSSGRNDSDGDGDGN
jgi:hypothetical protein